MWTPRRLISTSPLFLATVLGTSALCAQTPTQHNITGNLSGVAESTGDLVQARFNLVNCMGATPTVPGAAVVNNTSLLTADPNTGQISGTIWGNEAITCKGAATTLYQLTYLRNNIPAGQPLYYRITSDFDPSTASQTYVAPPSYPLAGGLGCAAPQVLVGVLADFTPVCQYVAPGATLFGTGPPSANTCGQNPTTPVPIYVQVDAPATGGNTWLCFGGTWHQQGAIGPAGTVQVGTVTNLPPGSTPTVGNSGTNTAAIFNFGLVQGTAATIAIGTVSLLTPGSTPTVFNSGNTNAAVFNFGIPQGQQGIQGVPGPPTTARGAWVSGTSYNLGDAVGFTDGSSYVSLIAANTVTPGTDLTKWAVQALAGQVNYTQFSGLALTKTGPTNLLNPAAAADGLAGTGNGTIVFTGNNFRHSDYFPVIPGGTLISNTSTYFPPGDGVGWCFYDINKTYISGVQGVAAGTTVSVPSTAVYARTGWLDDGTGAVTNAMTIFSGSTLPSYYVPFGVNAPITAAITTQATATVASLALQPTQLTSYITGLNLPLQNLYNPANITTTQIIQINGNVFSGLPADFFETDFMSVVPGGTVVANTSTSLNQSPTGGGATYGWTFWDKAKNYISGIVGSMSASVPVTVPANALYARAMFQTSNLPAGGLIINTGTSTAVSLAQQIKNAIVTSGILNGVRWMPWGDSITAKMSGLYQAQTIAATGMTIPLQDARGGRRTDQIFENYSNNPSSGTSLGGAVPGDGSCYQVSATNTTVTATNTGIPCNEPGPWSSGNTLATDLTNVDLVTIFLGTNDSGLLSNLGSMSSTAGDGSYYGYIMAAISGIQTAKPGVRIMWITPYQTGGMTAANLATIVTAIKAVCGSYGVPVLDLADNSGVNTLTFSYYVPGDHTHPGPAGSAMLGRRFTSFIQQWY